MSICPPLSANIVFMKFPHKVTAMASPVDCTTDAQAANDVLPTRTNTTGPYGTLQCPSLSTCFKQIVNRGCTVRTGLGNVKDVALEDECFRCRIGFNRLKHESVAVAVTGSEWKTRKGCFTCRLISFARNRHKGLRESYQVRVFRLLLHVPSEA